ncbi:glycoside hydrolase family 43 protein [Terrabacter sp. Ter38]|uniref:glycoside hydrolase family 43 protein n=1 Tax=Terrabacter sp. Ter38 TaxID=2926030 RepID=UPI002119B27A|nr:glycoside hydrolase family 43 protein [Terrabacter sp. Ter38]
MKKSAVVAALAAAAVAATGALMTAPALAVTTGASARNVIAKDFPDPGFAKFTTRAQGTKYYLYATGGGFRVARSASPGSGFSVVGTSMNARPAWTFESTDSSPAQLWAPHVFQTATSPGSERFTMYFAARREAPGTANHNKHCIGAARSSSPTGPFSPVSTPLVCPPAGYSEAIDPVEYRTRYGNRYLVYKIGNYSPRRFQIMAVRVDNSTGTTLAGSPKVVLSASRIGSAVAEAPDVYRDSAGKVHLFVSRNGYKDCNYATQVWSGNDLFALGNPRWVGGMGISTTDRFCGPGGAEVINDGGVLRVAFHVRKTASPLVRPAWTGVLKWSGGNPYLS